PPSFVVALTASARLHTLPLHDALPISVRVLLNRSEPGAVALDDVTEAAGSPPLPTKAPHVAVADLDDDGRPDVVTSAVTDDGTRSEEHTSELQSRENLVCRLLLEKKQE